MATNKTIKGLTVEIGGDTTKLGKALENVNNKSKDLSTELGQINKLLKLDPGNTELLAQKQKVLSKAIENTADKLDTLKQAEKQVQQQFQRGEVSEEQVRALQREIVSATKAMDQYEQAAKETEKAIKGVGDGGAKMGEKLKTAGTVALKGLGAIAAAAAAAGAALIGAAESSREYRQEMGKLDVAFTTAGHSSEAATETYKTLQGVLGDTGQAVEAANHLAKLTDNEKELKAWTDICTGVYATFGASLPIEGLTEAANETAKVGQVTGSLADALNWAGVNEDAFNERLAKCSSEQARQTLIMDTLNGLYKGAAAAYRETNDEVIRANQANEQWASITAEVGGAVEPLLTDVKLMGATLAGEFVPQITEATGAFRDMLNGAEGAEERVGEAVSGIVTQLISKATELVPSIVKTGTSLVVSVATAIVEELPGLVSTVASTLVDCTPQLITGALKLLMALVTAVERLLPLLVKALPDIVMCIVDTLTAPNTLNTLINGALQLLLAICDAIPLLVQALVPLIPKITNAVINALLNSAPQLLKAAVSLLGAINKAIPQACSSLLKSLPQIWTTISGYLKQLPSKVVSIGADLVKGLWQGINDKYTWIKNKIKSWVGNVTSFLKKLFGINSPSKVTAYMGEMLDEGLAQGIEDNTKAPVNAMSDLSEDILGSAGGVDGLNIERQIAHSYRVSAAEASTQATGMIDKLDQILSAIKSGQILTINGNQLVGATVNTMNNALGQRRVLAERGAI
jgi:phage-related protein